MSNSQKLTLTTWTYNVVLIMAIVMSSLCKILPSAPFGLYAFGAVCIAITIVMHLLTRWFVIPKPNVLWMNKPLGKLKAYFIQKGWIKAK